MRVFTAGAVPARRQERSQHTFEMVSPIVAVMLFANLFLFFCFCFSSVLILLFLFCFVCFFVFLPFHPFADQRVTEGAQAAGS